MVLKRGDKVTLVVGGNVHKGVVASFKPPSAVMQHGVRVSEDPAEVVVEVRGAFVIPNPAAGGDKIAIASAECPVVVSASNTDGNTGVTMVSAYLQPSEKEPSE